MKLIGDRSLYQIFSAVFEPYHYYAFFRAWFVYVRPVRSLYRYIFASGKYPCGCLLNSPLGVLDPELFSCHDLLTVNEVFCREDYKATERDKVVVDIGSNIGISALYFLTRGPESRIYLFEPDPRNAIRLKENLLAYSARYELYEEAVSLVDGTITFGIEETGRYGGIGVKSKQSIQVDCRSINSVLSVILGRENYIDILKIDTEGVEVDLVEAIDPMYLNSIGRIYIEAHPRRLLHPSFFLQCQRGSVCKLVQRSGLSSRND